MRLPQLLTCAAALVGPWLAACSAPDPSGEPGSGSRNDTAAAPWPDRLSEYNAQLGDENEYRTMQMELAHGWNTWDSRDVLRHVLLPSGLTVDLAIKRHAWLEEGYLGDALIGRRGDDVEKIRPGVHALDGSYMRLDIEWQGLSATVEAMRAMTWSCWSHPETRFPQNLSATMTLKWRTTRSPRALSATMAPKWRTNLRTTSWS